MKFGFDIDDTLINLREYAFHLYNKTLNQKVPIDRLREIRTIGIHDLFGLTPEEGRQLWSSLKDTIYFSECPPYPYAVQTLQKLDRLGHEIYYVTARAQEHGDRTREWLIKNGFPVHDKRFYWGMDDSEKVHIIRELGLDYYFDDKPAVLETLGELGLQVYAKDHPYNRHMDIPRITCWSELQHLVDSLEDEK